MTVLLWGVPSEPPMAMVARQLAALGGDILIVPPGGHDQHAHISFGTNGPVLSGAILVDGRSVELDRITGAYLRPVEPRGWRTPAGCRRYSPAS